MNKIPIVLSLVTFGAISWFAAPEARAAACPGWGCGSNSATVGDGIVFDELDTNGRWLPNGIRIQTATLNGTRVQLEVKGHLLSATDLNPGAAVHRGADLKGLTLVIQHLDGRAYEVQVYRAHEKCERRDDPADACLQFWVAPKDEVPYFDFRVKKIRNRRPGQAAAAAGDCGDDRPIETTFKEQLCKGTAMDPGLWQAGIEHAAITFEGDHFDAEKKTVREVKPARGRFNLACAGAAIAKMHLLRYTSAGSIPTPGPTQRTTTVNQRTAMLKMLTADYCGDGSAFTADGTPLRYADRRGWYVSPVAHPTPTLPFAKLSASPDLEAIWNEKGVICMNDPRRLPSSPVVAACTAPGVTRPEVASHCKSPEHGAAPHPIPRCDTTPPPAGAAKGYVVSVNVATPGPYCDPP